MNEWMTLKRMAAFRLPSSWTIWMATSALTQAQSEKSPQQHSLQPLLIYSDLHLNTRFPWVPRNSTRTGTSALAQRYPFLYSLKQKQSSTGTSKLHTWGHKANMIGSQDGITSSHACLEELTSKYCLCCWFITVFFPPEFLQISGPKSTAFVVHSWFLLTQDIGQDLVHSAKFLFGKCTRFFSLTLRNLVLKRCCFHSEQIDTAFCREERKQGVVRPSSLWSA